MEFNQIVQSDALEYLRTLPEACADCCVTSPPYLGLRSYEMDGQIGLEKTISEYVQKLTDIFTELRRVLRLDGTLWLNLGDTFASDSKGTGGSSKKQSGNVGSFFEPIKTKYEVADKNLIGVPWRVAFALQNTGWVLRSDIIWEKPVVMPTSAMDRPALSHEHLFLLANSQQYYYDYEAIKEPVVGENGSGITLRNRRSVWTINKANSTDNHYAVMPEKLIAPCVLAGSRLGGLVLDPFMGSGSVALVAKKLGRLYGGCDINPEYVSMARRKLEQPQTLDLFQAEKISVLQSPLF